MTGTRYIPDIHHRRSIRLTGYDYASTGAYFVTICTHNRECLFGEITDGAMCTNSLGQIVSSEWLLTDALRREITLDAYVVMPNHFHAIVVTTAPTGRSSGHPASGGAHSRAPLQRRPRSLASLMAGFKASVTTRINAVRESPGTPVWQRNYYEHVIRSETDLVRLREYIAANPARWPEDENHPHRVR